MKVQKFIKQLTTGLLILASLSMIATAHATIMLRISDGSGAMITASDSGTGATYFFDPFGGAVTFAAFDMIYISGISTPIIGDSTAPSIDLFSLAVTSNFVDASLFSDPLALPTLKIELTVTDFINPNGTSLLPFINSLGGTTDGAVTFASYLDSDNVAFNTTGSNVTMFNDFSFSSSSAFNAFSDSTATSAIASGDYSITIVANVTHSGQSQSTSFNHSIKVPEPNSLAIMGIGLLGIGFVVSVFGRKKRH